jgi:hypothetical protein
MNDNSKRDYSRTGRHRFGVRIGAVIAIALAGAFAVWLFVKDDSSPPSPTTTQPTGAVPISVDGLKTLAGAVGGPIYWVGPKSGVTYELTQTSGGNVFVRYLPTGVPVGSKDAYLTVGTYKVDNAYSVTSALATKDGSVKVPVSDGGIAFYGKNSPTSVYLAYPNSNYQIEVYDPSASQAQSLVSSDQVTTVPAKDKSGTPTGAAKAVSPAKLTPLAGSLGYPVYWIGKAPKTTYEVTQTSGGLYLRYLPVGVPVGSRAPYLTIGSYPVADAFKVTTAKSKKAGAVRIGTTGGGVAFYSKSRPTSVYVAYPNVDVQLEVYDPSPARARKIVASGRLKRVG